MDEERCIAKTLVAINVAKFHHDVLIECPDGSHRQMHLANTRNCPNEAMPGSATHSGWLPPWRSALGRIGFVRSSNDISGGIRKTLI